MPMFKSFTSRSVAAALIACALFSGNSRAQTPIFTQVHTVAATDVAVPVEQSVTIPADGTYQVTLIDLGAQNSTPAPLLSAKLAITSGSGTLVGTPITAPGSAQFTMAAGTYMVHVTGLPDPTKYGSGAFGVQITNTANNSQVPAFQGYLTLPPSGIPNNRGVLNDTFTVPTTGSYQISLTDFQFPQSLGALTLAISAQSSQGGAVITMLPGGANPVTLQTGTTYYITAGGQAGTAVNAGLYGVNVSPVGGGAPVYSQAVPVGGVTLLASPTLAPGSYTLQFKDLNFPNQLSSNVGAVVAFNGQAAAQVTGPTSQTFTAVAGTYPVFSLGLPLAPAATGAYSVTLTPQSGAPVLSVARAVSAAGSALTAYNYDTTVTTAGSYSLDLADFGLSASFTSLSAAAFQNGFELGSSSLTSAGTLNVTPAAGPVSVLVVAQPGSEGSLFGVDLTASGSSSPLFATTQGVGQLFGEGSFTVPSSGSYTVTVSDVGFPTKLAKLGAAVTQGANNLGSAFTGGTFTFTGTAGTTYIVSALAQPGTTTTDHAGTYSVTVTPTPAAPVVTLSSSASSVTSGGTVALTWTSQNATVCTGSSTPSGVWTTSQLTGNAQQTGAITTSTTFTLTCTGAGGSATQTASVTVASSLGGGGHGGGAIGLDLVALLSALVMGRLVTQHRRIQ
jgi:hypothetical protein